MFYFDHFIGFIFFLLLLFINLTYLLSYLHNFLYFSIKYYFFPISNILLFTIDIFNSKYYNTVKKTFKICVPKAMSQS